MTRTLTTLWAALVALFLVIFPAACIPSGRDTGPEGDADADADGDTDSDADADYAIGVQAGIEATFSLYNDDTPTTEECEDTFGCWLEVPGPDTYTVYAKRDDMIFVPQTVTVTEGDTKPLVDWTALPGLEGYAPQGLYIDERDMDCEVETRYGDPDDYYGYDHVYLRFDGMATPNTVTFGEFEGSDERGETVDGTISENLETITYHLEFGTGNSEDGILTKVW